MTEECEITGVVELRAWFGIAVWRGIAAECGIAGMA